MLTEINDPDVPIEKISPKKVELRIKHNGGNWIRTEISFILGDGHSGSSQVFGIIREIMDKEKHHEDTRVKKLNYSAGSASTNGINYEYHVDLANDIPSKSLESYNITRREKEVLRLIADGHTAKEVANKLFISIHTAINHRKNLITKFQVKNIAELIKGL